MAEEKPKEWEQPWPPTKIRQQAVDWNLAGDAGLLLYLRQASADLMSRFENTKKNMGDLTDEAQKSVVRLESTINDFSRLANNQFIENRVYDDDVKMNRDSKPKQEVAKTKEEREAEVVSVMKSALETGCAVLNSHFTKIDVRSLDFDEEDDASFKPQPVFEPKDPYSNRPLPYIIGTANFLRSDFVGLREDEDEIEAQKKEEDLASESDEEATTPVPTVGYNKPVAAPLASSAAKPIAVSISPTEKAASDSSSSGLFGTSADSAENAFPVAAPGARQPKVEDDEPAGQVTRGVEKDFRSELTKRLAGAATGASSTTAKEKPKESVAPSAPKEQASDEEDLLFSPPPLLPRQKQFDDSDDDGGGLFKSRGRGLFDDDEEDESKPPPLPRGRLQQLVDSTKDVPVTRNDPQVAVPVSRESSKSSVSTSTGSAPPASQVQTTTSAARPSDAKSKGASMFADDDEDEDGDDLFGKVYKKEQSAPRAKQPSSSVKSSSEERSQVPAAVTTRPVSSSNVIGAGASLFGDDDDDEDDLFAAVLKRPKQQGVTKSSGLFGDDVSKISRDKEERKPSLSPDAKQEKQGTSLSSDSVPVQKSATTTKPTSDSLFSRSPSPPPVVPPPVSTVKKDTSVSKSKSGGGLFGEDSDDDSLFPISTTVKQATVKAEEEEKPIKKLDFRAELSKKLVAGPQSGGLVKPAIRTGIDEQTQETTEQVSPMPSSSLFENRKETPRIDEDLFQPPAHGLFGNDSDDKVDDVENKLSFDSVTNVETLPTLNKNRAKLPNRRPPSKHPPAGSSEQNGFDSPPAEPPRAKEDAPKERTQPKEEKPISIQSSINADPLGVETIPASDSIVEPSPVKKSEEPAPKKVQEKINEKPAQRSIASSLFDDEDEDDIFGKVSKNLSRPKTSIKESEPEGKKPVVTAKTATTAAPAKVPKTATTRSGGGGLFSDVDDDDDLFSDMKRPVMKKPAQKSPGEDIFDTKKATSQTIQQKPIPAPSQNTKGKSLFDDDDDDDIFR